MVLMCAALANTVLAFGSKHGSAALCLLRHLHKDNDSEEKMLNKVIIFVFAFVYLFLRTKSILVAS